MVSENAEQVASLLGQAGALMLVRRYQDAEERARRAVALAPQDVNALCTLSRAQSGLGRYVDAARTAEEAIRVAPGAPYCFQLRAIALTRLAIEHHGAGRTRFAYQAAESARESVRLAPSDPNGYLRLAEALRLTRDYREAEAAAQEAIRLVPNGAAAWVTASLVALSTKNWEAAITACQKALSIDPSNYAAMNNLGVALRGSGRRQEGTKVLAEAARIDPDAPTARTNLTRAGLNVARIAVMVVLIPIGFLAHIGFGLYVVFALLSNVLIARYPDRVLRFERWATPIALFVSRRGSRDAEATSVEPLAPEDSYDSLWSATEGLEKVGVHVLWVVVLSGWIATLILLAVCFAVPGDDKFATAAVVTGFAAVCVWPTLVLRRRYRRRRTLA